MDPAVDRLQRRGARDARVIGLGGGLPSPTRFPRAALAGAFVRALEDPRSPALQYGWPEGTEGLRAFVAARLRARGADVRPDDVIITSGAQQAIAIAARVAVGTGGRLAVDAATYPAALDLFRTLGMTPVTRAPGVDAGAAYVMPALDNPRGQPLDPAARAALLGARLPVIEDDAYADLGFDGPAGPPLLAEARGRVFHVGTFSKTLCPGLRVGWLVPPRARRARALRIKHDLDLQASTLAQVVVEDWLGCDDLPAALVRFDAHLASLRRHYRWRARRLLAAVRRHLPRFRVVAPRGGFSLWLESALPLDDTTLLARAVEEGVSFDPGRLFRPSGARTPLALRLCFSSESPERFEEGTARLARALEDALVSQRRTDYTVGR